MTIFQINIFLLCLISLMAICHRGPGRKSAFAYAVIMVSQAIIVAYLEDYEVLEYFKVCGIGTTSALIVLCSFPNGSKLSDILVGVSGLSWIATLAGFIAWSYDCKLDHYYYTWTALYLVAATTMLWEDGHYDTGRGTVHNFFRVISYPGLVIRRTIHREAKG